MLKAWHWLFFGSFTSRQRPSALRSTLFGPVNCSVTKNLDQLFCEILSRYFKQFSRLPLGPRLEGSLKGISKIKYRSFKVQLRIVSLLGKMTKHQPNYSLPLLFSFNELSVFLNLFEPNLHWFHWRIPYQNSVRVEKAWPLTTILTAAPTVARLAEAFSIE